MSFRGKLANVLEAFRAEESLLLWVFMAPSLVLLVSRSERKAEGVSPVHLNPGQLTGRDLIATVRSAGGIYLFRVHSGTGGCTKVPAARRTVGTDTISELLLPFSALLHLAVTAARVLQSSLVLKGTISFGSTCKFPASQRLGCFRRTYFGDAELLVWFAAETSDCDFSPSTEGQTGAGQVSWIKKKTTS